MAQDPNAEQPKNEDNNEENKEMTKSEQIQADREQWLAAKKSFDAIMPLCDQIARLKALGNKPNKLKNTKKKRNKQIKDFETKLSKLPSDNEKVIKGKELAAFYKDPEDTLTSEILANKVKETRDFTSGCEKMRRELLAEYKKAKAEEDPEYGKPQKGDEEEENQ